MALEQYRFEVDKLREVTGDILPHDYNNDYDLYRWAKGWRGKIDEILPRINKHVAIRKLFQLDGPHFPDLITDSGKDHLFASIAAAFGITPLDPRFCDKEGHLLAIMKLGGLDVAEVANQIRCRDNLWFFSSWGDRNRRVILEAEQVARKPLGITVIMDLDGINVTKLAVDCFRGAPKISLQMAQEHYPEQTTRMLFVNVPTAIEIIVSAAKPFLYEETRQKMIFLSGDYEEKLREYVDPQYLPAEYGGSRQIAIPHPNPQGFCTDGLYSKHELPGDLRTLHIKPKSTVHVSISIQRVPGKGLLELEWHFETNSEIIFGIEMKSLDSTKWIDLVPKLSIVTSPIPDFGKIALDQSNGEIIRLCFTNQSTVLFSAKVKYHATIGRTNGGDKIILSP